MPDILKNGEKSACVYIITLKETVVANVIPWFTDAYFYPPPFPGFVSTLSKNILNCNNRSSKKVPYFI